MKRTHYSIALVVLAVSAQVALADPLGTAFTYQGRLADGGQPANGSYDLRFILYDAEIGGSQQGNVLTNSAVAVSGGLFTTALDFGATVFGGDARWLEIAVRQHGTGGFVPLDPRQPLTPTPYALFASNTATIGGQSPAAFAPASGSSAYVARTGDTMTGALNLPVNGLTVGGYQLTASGGHVRIGAASLTTPLSVGADAAGGINVGNVAGAGCQQFAQWLRGYSGRSRCERGVGGYYPEPPRRQCRHRHEQPGGQAGRERYGARHRANQRRGWFHPRIAHRRSAQPGHRPDVAAHRLLNRAEDLFIRTRT